MSVFCFLSVFQAPDLFSSCCSGFEVKHNYGLFMGNSNPQNVTFKEKEKKFATGKGARGFISVVV